MTRKGQGLAYEGQWESIVAWVEAATNVNELGGPYAKAMYREFLGS